MQGKVVVRRDAGQVVAGNAVTNIENYVAVHPRRPSAAAAFFWAQSLQLQALQLWRQQSGAMLSIKLACMRVIATLLAL